MATNHASKLPSPSPSPPRGAESVLPNNNLPGHINSATRKQHTELNRLIVNRLSLALPPNVASPLLYGKGLVLFSRIFYFFEVEWDLLSRQVNGKKDVITGSHDYQVRRWLAALRPEGMARTGRVLEDLAHLNVVVGSHINDTADMDHEWLTKMRILVRSKPHVLVAFAWVMYMAVFSGGRWIRQQLASAGPEFWAQSSRVVTGQEISAPMLELRGFSFLSFKGEYDGEEIKSAFKSGLEEAEILLTPQEKQEVVETSKELFEHCIRLVHNLDRKILRERFLRLVWAYVPGIIVVSVLLVLYFYGRQIL